MLFVEEIKRKKPLVGWETLQSLRYTRRDVGSIINLKLRDMDTGRVEELSTYDCSVKVFERLLRRRNPWGYLVPPPFSSSFLLVTVDKLSFQFLQYVEIVKPIEFSLDDTWWKSLVSCHFYDRLGQFVEWWHTDETCICPMFQMMCLLSDGWHGDKYYFKNNELRGRKFNSGMCVTFNDSHKARTLIAKARAMGYNPMGKLGESLGILC